MVENAEMLGFSRVLRCWCADGMIFKFYVREYIEKFNNISIILKKYFEILNIPLFMMYHIF